MSARGWGSPVVAAVHCCLSVGSGSLDASIDDGDQAFAGWSPAELHEFFTDHPGDALFAGQFLDAPVRAALLETAGPRPSRGVAVFAADRPPGGAWEPPPAEEGALRHHAASVVGALRERATAARWPERSDRPHSPLALRLVGKRRFDWLEPVVLDLELRNLDAGRPLPLGARPEPAYGA
ncbi:MAG TPA: hypothetical protein VFG43_00430, partial [Geminicoccaceae bacterium]|nr:hypothetical protein [Geminicoccaceae bacterium]